MSLQVGAIVEGKVSNVMPFGAFVSLPDNKTGLVHISEVASNYIKDIGEHIKTGDVVKVKIIKIEDDGKISLSIKKAQSSQPKQREQRKDEPRKSGPVRPIDIDWKKPASAEMSFEDKLSKFKQDSDEKMQALKRSNDSKRSGGYRRGGGF
jgi:S1 RNA binding domain protein